MSLLPSCMQFADASDFKPLGKPLRHSEERDARIGATAARTMQLNAFRFDNHGAADGGCKQERLSSMLGNLVALNAAYENAAKCAEENRCTPKSGPSFPPDLPMFAPFIGPSLPEMLQEHRVIPKSGPSFPPDLPMFHPVPTPEQSKQLAYFENFAKAVKIKA